MEKSEPVTPAYKVDVSFVNTPLVRKADKSTNKSAFSTASTVPIVSVPSAGTTGTALVPTTSTTPTMAVATGGSSPGVGGTGATSAEEPRVPPLHISLRGRNASVVQIGKKEKKLLKESTSMTELDSASIKRRGKLKKMKDGTDGNKLLQKKSLNMIIGKFQSYYIIWILYEIFKIFTKLLN